MTHRLLAQLTGDNDEMPRLLTEAHRQGQIVQILTTTGKVQKATDSTTNLVMGGLVIGFDRAADANAQGKAAVLRLDIGGAKAVLKVAFTQATTGATVLLGSGGSGSLDTVTVDGQEILGGAVAYNASLDQTAIDAIAKINANKTNTRFYAYRSASATIKIIERIVTKEAFTVASTSTTIGTTDTAASGGKAPIAAELGKDAYVSDSETVKFAGTAKCGTFETFDIQGRDRGQSIARAGQGSLRIEGAAGTITSFKVAGTELLAGTITWTTSSANTALLAAASINLGVNSHGYFARAVDDTVYVWQTQTTVTEDIQAITTAGTLDVQVVRDVSNGSPAYCVVALRKRNAVMT